MSLQDRRAHSRLAVSLPVLVLQERCVEADRAELRDLSWEGAFVAMPPAALVGRRVRLVLRPEGRREELRLTGEVVRRAKDGFALRFEKLDLRAQDELRRLLGAHAPREEVTERTLPLTGLKPAANDTPPEIEVWSLRATLRSLLNRAG